MHSSFLHTVPHPFRLFSVIRTRPVSRRAPIDLPARFLTSADEFRYFPFPFHLISLDRARLPLVFHFRVLPARELHLGYAPS